jgi:hypothetical protein
MKRRLALLLFAAALAPAAAASAATTHHTGTVAVVKVCSSGYVHANLSWGEKCLRAGEFCKVGNREYLRYHFYCPPTGHLRRR